MGRKYLFYGIGAIAVFAFLFVAFGITSPEEDAQRAQITGQVTAGGTAYTGTEETSISTSSSSFLFEGFGPGKSHVGSFEEYSGTLHKQDGKIVGFEGTIQSDSLTSEEKNDRLESHLKSEDFLNVESYPIITFKSKSIDSETGVVTGDLTFLGVSKEISFQSDLTDNSVSTDFVLDASEFGLSNPAANDEVRIAFTINA